jgi:hypothetical protein
MHSAIRTRENRCHSDVLMRGCSIALDGRAVVAEGGIVGAQMRVARIAP